MSPSPYSKQKILVLTAALCAAVLSAVAAWFSLNGWLRILFLCLCFLLPILLVLLAFSVDKRAEQKREKQLLELLKKVRRADAPAFSSSHLTGSVEEETQRIAEELQELETLYHQDTEEHTQFVLSWISKFQKSISDLEQIRLALEKEHNPACLYVEREKMAMDGMLEQIRSYFTSALKKQKYTMQEVELSKVISDAVVRNSPIFNEKSIGFRRNTMKIIVHTDPHLFGIALDEVLANAIKHSEKSAYIGIMCRDCDDCIRLVIEDSGDGISAEDFPYIFEKGYSGKNEPQGSAGMGLFLAKSYLSLLGHDIIVEPRESHGTKVSIVIKKL